MIENINSNSHNLDYKTGMRELASDLSTVPKKDIMTLPESVKRINVNHVAVYYPNVKVLSPAEKFERALKNNLKHNDGNIILRPLTAGQGSNKTKHADNGTFTVNSEISGADSQIKNPEAPGVKQLKDGTFDVTYVTEDNGEKTPVTVNMNREEFINFLSESDLSI